MELNLRYRPGEDTVANFAADMVDGAREISGVELDYSEASLEAVDSIIQSFCDQGLDVDQMKETLFGFGCYVGEVFVRSAGGRWKELQPGDKSLSTLGWPLVVELPNGSLCNPIGKVFKRLEFGEGENLPYFYRVFVKPGIGRSGVPGSDA
jgi:hypothetical protein